MRPTLTKEERRQTEGEIMRLREEVSRIMNITLRGDFRNEDDRIYWQERARTLTSKLSALEDLVSNKNTLKAKGPTP